jgi:hypothetical protein
MRAMIVYLPLACVPLVDLDGAPCPCGEGFACCSILGVCLPDGDACPIALPSSRATCALDADCLSGEACAAWTADDGTVEGPRICRRRCADDPCADGERCLLSLSGGRPAKDLPVAPLCLDERPGDPCADWTCEGCPGLALGEITVCRPGQDVLMGCMFALHPACGLKCELRSLGSCNNIVSPCQELDCAMCPGGGPGAVECRTNELVTCLSSKAGDQPCDRLCVTVEVGSCE